MALRLAITLASLLLLAGCGGDDEAGSTTAATGAEASSCAAATSEIMTPIGNTLSLEGGRVRNGQMVESGVTPGIWFVAVEVDGPGYEEEGDVATFATANRFGADAIYSVDELANQHFGWRDVAQADGIEADDPAADEAAACVGG